MFVNHVVSNVQDQYKFQCLQEYMKTPNAKKHESLGTLCAILNDVPQVKDKNTLALWKRSRHMTLRFQQQYWNRVTDDAGKNPMFNEDAQYQKWHFGGYDYIGLRMPQKRGSDKFKEHGVVREVGSDYIFERSSLNGQKHGLERFIDYSSIRFTLYKEGQQLAYIEFNDEFKMKDKFGKLLDRLPIDFNAAKLPIDALEYKANHAEEVKEKVLGLRDRSKERSPVRQRK